MLIDNDAVSFWVQRNVWTILGFLRNMPYVIKIGKFKKTFVGQS